MRFGVFGLGATVPSVEDLQVCRVFQCLRGAIMLWLIKQQSREEE